MTRPSPLFATAFAVALAAAGWANAAETPPALPSLRHLAFDVEVGVKDEYEKRLESSSRVTPGVSRRSPANEGRIVPPDQRTAAYDRHAKGRITCDVVAATPDGGLVVDIREEASERSAPLVRVAVEPNGHLGYAPASPLLEEEIALLRLLAREVVGTQQHETGTSWIVEDSGKGYSSKTIFRVVEASGAADLRLDLDREYRQEGLDGIAGATQGKLRYDQSKLVPRSANLESQARRETPEGYRVVRMAINLTLVEDSFGRR